MKKIITTLVLLVIILSIAIPTASSREYVRAADSASVSQTLRSQLDAEDSDTVIRIYHMSIKDAFTEHDTVDQALISQDLSQIYYAVMDPLGAINYYENTNGRYHRANAGALNIPIDFYLEGNMQIWNQIGSDAIIYYRYFIHGTAQDSAVFYKTSQGDFVYYTAPGIGQNLFPLKDFISYQNAPYPLPGSREYAGLEYKFSLLEPIPISENIWLFLSLGALLLIAGSLTAAVILYRKKYKLHLPSLQPQETPFDPDLIIDHCINCTAPAKQL